MELLAPGTHRPHRPALRPWADLGWPVLAGATAALGVVGLTAARSLLGLLLLYAVVAALVALPAWLTSGVEGSAPAALRTGAATALVLVLLLGLALLLPRAGWGLAALVAVTSPWAVDRVHRRLRPSWRAVLRPPSTHRAPRADGDRLVDQAWVDARFRELVAGLREDR